MPFGARDCPLRRYNQPVMQRTDTDFTFDEAVRTMGVTPERLERLIAEGRIEADHSGIFTLIPRRAILEYLAENNGVTKRERERQKRA